MKNFTNIILHVAHIGCDIQAVGTREEVESYRASMDFNTSCWDVSSLDVFASSCYELGYDAASYETFV